jgi:hypothetical protein
MTAKARKKTGTGSRHSERRHGRTSRAVRVRAARHFTPGRLRADGPGTVLRCLVLVPGPDWVAVDLESGALVRAPASPAAEHANPPESGTEVAEVAAGAFLGRTLSAVELAVGVDPGPTDPARPEAVVLARPPAPIGEPRRRATRRLLQHLVTRATDRPLLGTLGPSICYADLEGTRPSVVVVAPKDRPRFGVGPSGPWCQFVLGGRRHTLPCSAEALPDASANGHVARLLVVALGPPTLGQVPKVVLGTLPHGRG